MLSSRPFVIQPSGPDLRTEDIEAFEKRWSLELPAAYRTFMLSCNGGAIARPMCELAGESLYAQFLFQLDPKGERGVDYETRSTSLPRGWLSVILEGSGGRIVLSANDGSVWYAPPEAWTKSRTKAMATGVRLADDWESFAASCTGDSGEKTSEEETINRIVRNSDVEELDRMLAQGFDLSSRNVSRNTLVHLAAMKQNFEFLDALLARGASLSGALHVVAKLGKFGAAKWLHSRGADLEERNEEGKLPEEVARMKLTAANLRKLRLGECSEESESFWPF